MNNRLQVFDNVMYIVRRIGFLSLYIVVFFMIQGCNGDDDNVILSDDKQITAFLFETSRNAALDVDVVGILDQNTMTITVTVPFNTNITALKTTIVQSEAASITPNHKIEQDFSNPVTYIVTAQDGTKQIYEVFVKVEEPSNQREFLIAFYNANPDNTLNWDIENKNMNSWEGVSLNDDGNVVGLSLINKSLSDIPSSFGNLRHLTTINLNNNNLTYIPAEIGNLTQLTILNLSENNLTNIPKEIRNLINLKTLNLYSNGLTSIPVEIGNLKNLNILYLKLNRLNSIPVEIGKLTKLTDLNLSKTSLTNIPAEIGSLTNLTMLSIGYNSDLTSIPSEVGNLIKLTTINAYGSGLTSIPKEIGNLINLTSLSLGSNALTSIPAEISNLTKLDYLAITDNNLTNIPKAVCDLETNYGTTVLKDAEVNCI